MKEISLTILAVCLLFLSLYVPFRIAYLDNQPKEVTVGPNQTYRWSGNQTFSSPVEGIFSLKSDNYFQLQYDQVIVQAAYEAPTLGEETGLYWIRDLPMSGTWSISNPATLFSLEPTTVTISASFGYKFTNYCLAVFFCFVLLVISLIILIGLEGIIPG